MPERKTAYAEYDEQSREIFAAYRTTVLSAGFSFVITKAQCQISKESYSVSQAKKEAEASFSL